MILLMLFFLYHFFLIYYSIIGKLDVLGPSMQKYIINHLTADFLQELRRHQAAGIEHKVAATRQGCKKLCPASWKGIPSIPEQHEKHSTEAEKDLGQHVTRLPHQIRAWRSQRTS